MSKRLLFRIILITAVILSGSVICGFTTAGLNKDAEMLNSMLSERAVIMQRAMFEVYDTEDGVADINDVYDAFHQLAEIETYPLLAGDCSAISSSAGSDYDKVLNMETLNAQVLSKNGNSKCYEVSIRWYMSGYDGYYQTENRYRVTVVNDNGAVKLSRMEVIK